MDAPSALSRHRLPAPYRRLLPLCWLALPSLVLLAMLAGAGLTADLFNPRLWLPLLLLCLPAAYIWQEGVDVCPTGLRCRIHVRRFVGYAEIAGWVYDARPDVRVLRVFDEAHQVLLECRAGHLTEFARLLEALETHLPQAGRIVTAPPERGAESPR